MITNKEFLKKLESAKNIAIFSHREPDPDALGSMFGMRDLCLKLGKNADVFFCDEPADFMKEVYPVELGKNDFDPDKYDTVVIVDLHVFTRLNVIYQKDVTDFKNLLILDHHEVSNDEVIATKNCIIKNVAAASNLVVDLFKEAKLTPSKEGATYLYAGIMGDTDRFLHTNVTKQVFENAIYLMEAGADIQKVYDHFYRSVTKKSISVRKLLYKKLCYVEDKKGIYAVFTNKDMKKLKATIEDIKQYSNTLVRIEGVEVSFLVYQMSDGSFKVSMRSSRVDLVPLAKKQGGGGHKCAAAFSTNLSAYEIKRKIASWCKEILNG